MESNDTQVSAELIALLRCPETQQPLFVASAEVVERVNGESGRASALEGGLIREDGRLFFPIRNGLPILLLDEAIAIGDGPAVS